MRNRARLSTAVPQRTAFLPPEFSLMLPPTELASALAGSTEKTSPSRAAASVTRRVTAPEPVSMTGVGVVCPGSTSLRARLMKFIFSVLMTTLIDVIGTAPPVYPVPLPRGMMTSPNSTASRTKSGISLSLSGVRTANGNSTRQSVASVTWQARANPSKRMLSSWVWRLKLFKARRRSFSIFGNSSSKRFTAV